MTIKQSLQYILNVFRYNLKIIFADKFKYFLIAGVAFFLLVAIITLFDTGSNPREEHFYYWLLVPGILMVFYPTVFGIQNDVDSRTIEVLFGIPNYRYKVWLVRMLAIYVVVFLLLFVLAGLCAFAFRQFNVFYMVYQLMFPIFFLGCLSFLLSTVVKNGYGTAVIMVILGLFFWILAGALAENAFNLFLNPFRDPQNVSDMVWMDVKFKNRLYLIIGMIISLLGGLLNMQKREKFV